MAYTQPSSPFKKDPEWHVPGGSGDESKLGEQKKLSGGGTATYSKYPAYDPKNPKKYPQYYWKKDQ
tara:strand:+ start:778 stop:975 length:198 start_codon:yes stop_codon:yes gene_type:complete